MDAAQAFDYVGLPEGRYHLAHACLYLAAAPKSNSSMAFFDALKVVSEEAKDDVPNHLRDASRDGEGFGHGQGYLYPHAYRDHWVAQQYLPSELQGKVFYKPTDQGFEKSVRERVDRMREAQIEAMVEEEKTDVFEIRIAREKGGSSDIENAWIKRTGSRHGGLLALVRDELLNLSEIKHDDLVLDLHARTGLMSGEASRRTREGGVWALAHNASELEMLRGSAGDALSKPQVIATSFETFVSDLRKAAGEAVRFNVILGRNILTQQLRKIELVEKALELVGPDGRIVLAETVPKHGQRLSTLVQFMDARASFVSRFLEVEEDLFNDPDDSLLNWDAESLKHELEGISASSVKMFTTTMSPKTRILSANVDFWFRPSAENERKSLGERLAAIFDEQELTDLKAMFHRQLDNKDFPWKTVVAYFKITRG